MTDEPVIHGESHLETCDACKAQHHRGHVPHHELPDGALVACECRGECDGSLVWPPVHDQVP